MKDTEPKSFCKLPVCTYAKVADNGILKDHSDWDTQKNLVVRATMLANIVEQNIGQYLSESEFHAESNGGGVIRPNWTQEPIFSLEVSK